jgi:hypothetical protein
LLFIGCSPPARPGQTLELWKCSCRCRRIVSGIQSFRVHICKILKMRLVI